MGVKILNIDIALWQFGSIWRSARDLVISRCQYIMRQYTHYRKTYSHLILKNNSLKMNAFFIYSNSTDTPCCTLFKTHRQHWDLLPRGLGVISLSKFYCSLTQSVQLLAYKWPQNCPTRLYQHHVSGCGLDNWAVDFLSGVITHMLSLEEH